MAATAEPPLRVLLLPPSLAAAAAADANAGAVSQPPEFTVASTGTGVEPRLRRAGVDPSACAGAGVAAGETAANDWMLSGTVILRAVVGLWGFRPSPDDEAADAAKKTVLGKLGVLKLLALHN